MTVYSVNAQEKMKRGADRPVKWYDMQMKPRNIFWIMTDEQRSDTLHLSGGGCMPCVSALANGAVRFDEAITPAPMCIPARTSILSGALPGSTGVWRNRQNPAGEAASVPPTAGPMEWIRDHGYATVSLGKQHYRLNAKAFATEESFILSDHVDYTGYLNGRDHRDYGGVRFPGPTPWIMAGVFPGPTNETSEWRLVDRAIELVQERDRSRPLLMRLSFNAPHTPVSPPAEYLDRAPPVPDVPGSLLQIDPEWPLWLRLLQGTYANATQLAPDELARVRRHYYAQCAFLDAMICRFVSFLRETGLLEESVLVYTSDHGAHLGEHGLIQKQSFFRESVNVPFFFAGADVAPRVVETPVTVMSLLPTAGVLAGLTCPPIWRALDFAGVARGTAELAPAPVISQGMLNPALLEHDNRLVMVRETNLKGVFDIDDPAERCLLYDLERDPHELSSVDCDPSYANSLERLRSIAHDAGRDGMIRKGAG